MKLGVCLLLSETQQHSLMGFWTSKTTKCGNHQFLFRYFLKYHIFKSLDIRYEASGAPQTLWGAPEGSCGHSKLLWCIWEAGRRLQLQKPDFWTLFSDTPFWNPYYIPKYSSNTSNPYSCENRESQLYESFGHFRIGWELSDGSFGKDHMESWGAYPGWSFPAEYSPCPCSREWKPSAIAMPSHNVVTRALVA